MTSGSPDWVRRIQVSFTVEGVPVVPEPGTEVSAGANGKYSGVDTTYQTVCTWTVTASKVGELKEILVVADDYSHTQTKITIGGNVWCTDWAPQSALPLIFEDLKLSGGQTVIVQVKSDDGSPIVVDAVIVGKEVG